MTSLEKRAVRGLIIGVIWAAVFFSVFFVFTGVEAHPDRPKFIGIAMAAIVIVGSVAYLIFYILYRQCAKFDERDRLIFIRASDLQLAAVIFTVGGWSTALQHMYREAGQVPTAYLFLIVVSMIIASFIMQSIGLLLYSRHTEHIHKV